MRRVYDGKDLAKVLIYFGLICDVTSARFNIMCPFHEDVNPSMMIDITEGNYYCFGCGASGNALDFVRNVHPELNDLQCCILLEKIVRSNEVKSLKLKYKKRKKSSNKQAIEEAYTYFYGLKTTDWNNLETEEEQKAYDYMKQRGFTRKTLNIANCKTNPYNIAYRIIFPILDNGEFKGWVARTTNKYVEKKRKYLYNDGFQKRTTLCGTYEQNKIVYICEGYMDYLSLRTRGHLKNVVAILGWHISDEQVNKLKQKNIKRVVSVLDNDKAGRKGTEYLKNFFEVVEFVFPEGVKDAGEMTERQIKKAIQETKRRWKQNASRF